jgi:hypothetical protein
MKTYAGIDLHSSNNYIGVIDAKDKRLYSKRHDNRIEDVLKVLGKFKASLQSMITRNRGLNFSGAQIKRFRDEFIEKLFSDRHLVFTAKRNIETIRFIDRIVSEIEIEVKSQIKLKKEFVSLLTTLRIGNILGLTIMLEVGDIHRFAKVGNYSSYCRCVEVKNVIALNLMGLRLIEPTPRRGIQDLHKATYQTRHNHCG